MPSLGMIVINAKQTEAVKFGKSLPSFSFKCNGETIMTGKDS